jgi:hypothetical protein
MASHLGLAKKQKLLVIVQHMFKDPVFRIFEKFLGTIQF